MNNFFETVYGLVVEPAKTLAHLTREAKPVLLALAFFAVVQILSSLLHSNSMLASVDIGSISNQFMGAEGLEDILGRLMMVLGTLALLIATVSLFIQAGLLGLVGELLGGQANSKGMLVGLAFSSLPGLLISALLAGLQAIGLTGTWLELLAGLAAIVWTLFLQVLTVRESLLLPTGKAIFTLVIPFLAVVGGIIVTISATVMALV